MSDTIQRHITMLSLIPAAPGKISARDLHSRLEGNGFSIDIRTLSETCSSSPGRSHSFPMRRGQRGGRGNRKNQACRFRAWMRVRHSGLNSWPSIGATILR
jgi:hypothetical protein